MDGKYVIGKLATVCTIAVFLSGIEICNKIWKKRSTIDISALPFLCGLISCSFWLRYGLLISDSALIIVNSIGWCLQLIYLMIYASFASSTITFYKQLGSVVGIICFLYWYTTFWILDEEEARFISGIASCTAGVIFMASPLASVVRVVKTKSSDSLPFPLIFCTFVMATLWVCYGVMTNDVFVQVPNFLGAVLATCQLCLFAVYPGKKTHHLLIT